MGKKTIREWEKVPCLECSGRGYVEYGQMDDEGTMTLACLDDCNRCQGSGSINVSTKSGEGDDGSLELCH